MKKVTIITVTKNIITAGRASYFKQMFDSVHNQTYQNIEHLIIDGASDDGTVEWIKSLAKEAKKEFRIISEPDTGIYGAMNNGVRHAAGDYIAFMNSDDYYYTQDSIDFLVYCCEQTNSKFAYGATKMIDADRESDYRPDIDLCLFRVPFNHQSLLVHKSLFAKYGLFDESFSIAGDYDFSLRIIGGKEHGVELKPIISGFRVNGVSSKMRMRAEFEMAISIRRNLKCNINTWDALDIIQNKFSLSTLIKILRMKVFEGVEMEHQKIALKKHYPKSCWKKFIRVRFLIEPIERIIYSIFPTPAK